MTVMTNLPGNFRSGRLADTTDCSAHVNAVPGAIASKTSLLVGIRAEPNATFEVEKQVLLAMLQRYQEKRLWLIDWY
jgi:hypothetical protein